MPDTVNTSNNADSNTSSPPLPSSDTTPPMQRFIVRPPAFNADRPALWFAQLEGQFHLANITDETTKFFFASSHLDAVAAAEVQDIILHPPQVAPYLRLKGALIDRLTSSQETRLHQLLDKEILGDRKPSQFLRHLKGLVDNVPTNILRTKWLSRLPTAVQTILATQQDTNLEKLATLADHIMEISPINQIATVNAPARDENVTPIEPRLSRLEAVISELQFFNHDFPKSHASTTRRRIYKNCLVCETCIRELMVLDVPPQKKRFPADNFAEWNNGHPLGLRTVHAYVLVFDMGNLETFQYCRSMRDQILDSFCHRDFSIIVVGNKCDTITEAQSNSQELKDISTLVRKHWRCGYVECSAKYNYKIGDVFRELMGCTTTGGSGMGSGGVIGTEYSQSNRNKGRCTIL